MKGKFPEARAKVKEIVKLLQNEHFCSKYPFIDPMTGYYRIKCFERHPGVMAVKKVYDDFPKLGEKEKQLKIQEYKKEFSVSLSEIVRKDVLEIKNILDKNGYGDCKVRRGGSSNNWIIVEVPFYFKNEK